MTELPLTVLVHEGPTARAYLELMRRAGWRPRHIVVMAYERIPGHGGRPGRWIPVPDWRRRYQLWAQEQLLMHWPRRIRARLPAFYEALMSGLQQWHPAAPEIMASILSPACWDHYAGQVSFCAVSGLDDPRLRGRLSRESPGYVLFTGGGLVPSSLLALDNLRFLHVHPGWLPAVRGADGLLWSLLLFGRPAASCFFMTPGLDEGEILWRGEFDPLQFELPPLAGVDYDTRYRAIFSFIDPLLRALALSRLLEASHRSQTLPQALAQGAHEGEVYHFMHPELRDCAIDRLF